MRIELLVFEGCPNLEPAREMLQAGMASLGILGEVREIRVETPEEAQAWSFPGSPTLRVNGEDVAPLPADFEPALGCRTYMVQGRRQGLPDADWVVEALQRAQEAEAQATAPVHECCALPAGSGPTPGTPKDGGNPRRTVWAAIGLGVLASACCWVPLALAGAGVATGTLGARIAWIRPWALGGLLVLLFGVLGWWARKRFVSAGPAEDCCVVVPTFPALAVAILAASFALAWVSPRLLHSGRNTTLMVPPLPTPTGGTLLVLSTPQFDCPGCAGTLPQILAATPGVSSIRMDFDKRETHVVFQPGAAVDEILARWKKELGVAGQEIRREVVPASDATKPGVAGSHPEMPLGCC